MTTSTCSKDAILTTSASAQSAACMERRRRRSLPSFRRPLDSVAACHDIDQRPRRPLPAVEPGLPHQVHDLVLLVRGELSEPQAVAGCEALFTARMALR